MFLKTRVYGIAVVDMVKCSVREHFRKDPLVTFVTFRFLTKERGPMAFAVCWQHAYFWFHQRHERGKKKKKENYTTLLLIISACLIVFQHSFQIMILLKSTESLLWLTGWIETKWTIYIYIKFSLLAKQLGLSWLPHEIKFGFCRVLLFF